MFSTEVDDHKKVGDFPDEFPKRSIWADVLTKFRADRNLADYDHTARSEDLSTPLMNTCGMRASYSQKLKLISEPKGLSDERWGSQARS